ncbi:MAG TPA: methyl-accepting chemotaxis protein, partial [Anaeromyxobacteraceae bacterium]|nr:methyl-accepting chemotaxis protein [Anaeromyxobacteraceae bacterium]
NKKGERIGYVEVVQDLTPMIRVRDYTRGEVERLATNLAQLASGSIEFDVQVAKGDQHTVEAQENFAKIGANLAGVKKAMEAVIADTKVLSAAAVEGRLSVRADTSKHEGQFRAIAEGLNLMLDTAVRPLDETTAALTKLAQRDLTARVQGNYQGDHARMKDALNGTAEALHEAMAQVSEAVTQVSNAAGQIAAASQGVATGASEQAASLQETASQLESMSGMTKQSADNSRQANVLAQTARGAANEGSAAVEQMTSAMTKIKASAESTSQIIKDINEIAFQTNLLALNAAVEAARAGEAGRGFAVVAEEVRALALRSKEAASKTEELIRQSVKEAGEGEVTATHVSTKLAEIAGSVTKVSDIVAEIAASAKEQAAGIEQVNKAVEQMDKVTQANAAGSEQSSSAAAELSGQAEELAAMVGSFQLGGAGQAGKPVTHRPAKSPAKAPAIRPSGARGKGGTIALTPEELIPLEKDGSLTEF